MLTYKRAQILSFAESDKFVATATPCTVELFHKRPLISLYSFQPSQAVLKMSLTDTTLAVMSHDGVSLYSVIMSQKLARIQGKFTDVCMCGTILYAVSDGWLYSINVTTGTIVQLLGDIKGIFRIELNYSEYCLAQNTNGGAKLYYCDDLVWEFDAIDVKYVSGRYICAEQGQYEISQLKNGVQIKKCKPLVLEQVTATHCVVIDSQNERWLMKNSNKEYQILTEHYFLSNHLLFISANGYLNIRGIDIDFNQFVSANYLTNIVKLQQLQQNITHYHCYTSITQRPERVSTLTNACQFAQHASFSEYVNMFTTTHQMRFYVDGILKQTRLQTKEKSQMVQTVDELGQLLLFNTSENACYGPCVCVARCGYVVQFSEVQVGCAFIPEQVVRLIESFQYFTNSDKIMDFSEYKNTVSTLIGTPMFQGMDDVKVTALYAELCGSGRQKSKLVDSGDFLASMKRKSRIRQNDKRCYSVSIQKAINEELREHMDISSYLCQKILMGLIESAFVSDTSCIFKQINQKFALLLYMTGYQLLIILDKSLEPESVIKVEFSCKIQDILCYGQQLYLISFSGALFSVSQNKIIFINVLGVTERQDLMFVTQDQTTCIVNAAGQTVFEHRGSPDLVHFLYLRNQGVLDMERHTLQNLNRSLDLVGCYSDFIQISNDRNSLVELLAAKSSLALHVHVNAIIHWLKRQDSEDLTTILEKFGTSSTELLQICVENRFPDLVVMLVNFVDDANISKLIDFCFLNFAHDLVDYLLERCESYRYSYERVGLFYPVLFLLALKIYIERFESKIDVQKIAKELFQFIVFGQEKVGFESCGPENSKLNQKVVRTKQLTGWAYSDIRKMAEDAKQINEQLYEAILLLE